LPKSKRDLPDDLNERRLIDREQLKQLLPVSSMTLWRWERDGRIAKHVLIGRKAFWRLTDILKFLQQATKGEASK
jgi:predicted DNA-binding transcriptional regulator AlpA